MVGMDYVDVVDEDTQSSLYKGSLNLVDYLTNHFLNCYPKMNRLQANKNAKDYRRKIVNINYNNNNNN